MGKKKGGGEEECGCVSFDPMACIKEKRPADNRVPALKQRYVLYLRCSCPLRVSESASSTQERPRQISFYYS